MFAKTAIFAFLSGFTLSYSAIFLASLRGVASRMPSPLHLLTGFITDFFDTLGIGSFATTTSIFKFRRMVKDELIPGTLNVGHTLPTIFEAFIYISAIEVQITTLVLMIVSAVIGAWFGAGLVVGLSRRAVQIGMAVALFLSATAMLMSQLHLFPVGGAALGLDGWPLVLAVSLNFFFGAISALGIGFYAPCLTTVSLLGMNPAAAFPIMMGSCAFLMPVASARFITSRAYSVPVAVGLTLGGLLGVPLAAFVVKSLPLGTLRWLVIVVVLYAAVAMLRSARISGSPSSLQDSSGPPR